MTHDYKRNGTTTFACRAELLGAKSSVNASSVNDTRNFCAFAPLDDGEFPVELNPHPVLDELLALHSPSRPSKSGSSAIRVSCIHFVPTSCSWLNLSRALAGRTDRQAHPPQLFPQRSRLDCSN